MKPDESKDSNPAPTTLTDTPMPPSGDTKIKRKLNWVIILLLLLLLLLALLFGWIWWQDKDNVTPAVNEKKSSSSKKVATNPVACAAGFSEYQDKSLDIRFCYPEAWGTVSKHDAKFAAADTGSRWRLSFSDKEQVNLGLASPDWTTKVPRDGVCVDPAVQQVPPYEPFSTDWLTTMDMPVSSGSRGIEVAVDDYLIREDVDSVLTNGVCLRGYKVVNNSFGHAAATYYADFNATITNPEQHTASPTTLIPAGDRTDFVTFVKSIGEVI